MQIVILSSETLVLGVAIKGALALHRREGDRRIERSIQSVQIVEKVGDLVLEGGQLDEGKLLLLRVQVADDLEIDLLQDDVQLVQDLLLHLVENVLRDLHHNCQL